MPEKFFEALDIYSESVPHANNHVDDLVLHNFIFSAFLTLYLSLFFFFFFQLQCNFLLTVWNNRQVWLYPNLIINKKNFSVPLLIKVFKSHFLLLESSSRLLFQLCKVTFIFALDTSQHFLCQVFLVIIC